MELTPGELQEILRIFVDSELQELQLQVGDVTLAVSKKKSDGTGDFPVVAATPQAAPNTSPVPNAAPAEVSAAATVAGPSEPGAQPQVDRPGLHALHSPLVGVFYRRPGPDQPPYVEVGDEVKVGDPVCTISVMKMYTEVGADRAGRVVEIIVENETLVEHGQVLMYIEPTET